jgi:hypothetical protein
MIDHSYCPENLKASEQETSANILQENSRDYKRYDVNENSTEHHYDSQTEQAELIEPQRLVSPSSTESDASNWLFTTSLSTESEKLVAHSQVTTSRTPSYRSAQNYSSSYTAPRVYSAPSTSSSSSPGPWKYRQYPDLQQSQSSPYYQQTEFYSSPGPTSMIMMRDKWRNKSGCYYGCIQNARGIQTVVSKYDFATNIQLCEPAKIVSC